MRSTPRRASSTDRRPISSNRGPLETRLTSRGNGRRSGSAKSSTSTSGSACPVVRSIAGAYESSSACSRPVDPPSAATAEAMAPTRSAASEMGPVSPVA